MTNPLLGVEEAATKYLDSVECRGWDGEYHGSQMVDSFKAGADWRGGCVRGRKACDTEIDDLKEKKSKLELALKEYRTACGDWIKDQGFECGYLIYDAHKKVEEILK